MALKKGQTSPSKYRLTINNELIIINKGALDIAKAPLFINYQLLIKFRNIYHFMI